MDIWQPAPAGSIMRHGHTGAHSGGGIGHLGHPGDGQIENWAFYKMDTCQPAPPQSIMGRGHTGAHSGGGIGQDTQGMGKWKIDNQLQQRSSLTMDNHTMDKWTLGWYSVK